MEEIQPRERTEEEKINASLLTFPRTYTTARIMEIETEGEKKLPTVLTPSTNRALTYLFVMRGPGQRLQAVVPGTQSRGLGSTAAPQVPSLAAEVPDEPKQKLSLRSHLENGTE